MTPLPTVPALPAWWPVDVLLFSASLWGLSWWPLKGFAAAGYSGPALVLLTYGVVGLVGLPWLWRERPRWRVQGGLLLLLALAGGWAIGTWQHGVTHMEAGRSGVILIAELLVALVSASLIGGEHFALREWFGGALIVAAALIEATHTPIVSHREKTA